MSDMDHKDLDDEAPEFEEEGLKPDGEDGGPDPDEPWAKTSSGDDE